jgi:hypothetical protein
MRLSYSRVKIAVIEQSVEAHKASLGNLKKTLYQNVD